MTSILFAHDGIFIIKTEIRAVPDRPGEEAAHLIFVEIHLADKAAQLVIIYVIPAFFAVGCALNVLFHGNLLFS